MNRCGFRYKDATLRGQGGFRLNGVIRTGTSRGNARLYRSAHRQGYGRGIGNDASVGFRV